MNPQETAASYDKIAAHWNGDRFNRENGIRQHERAIGFVTDKRSSIDIGCGSSGRIIDLLLSSGFTVEGLDISTEMIRLAQIRHPHVLFHKADICEWDSPHKYDFISAWDSVWHVPLEQQRSILIKLCDALNSNGVLIYTTGGLERSDHITNPFLGQPLYTAGWGVTDLLSTIAQCGCICRHLEYDQYPEKHLYIIAQKVEQGAAANP
jgi:2-polyprenyl-3-methyl-5-hydroxy-6-metoxy-1,4-benzoquinol methylase